MNLAIKWGSYKQWEGPYTLGTKKFSLPHDPLLEHLLIEVITATEGGTFDAVNMYDSMICSIGLIQWVDAKYYLASKLLGAIASTDKSLLNPLDPILNLAQAEFIEIIPGKWRFKFKDSRGEVDEIKEQQQLYLLHTDGIIGNWDNESKEYAKL